MTREEVADAFAKDSKEFTQALTTAADAYKKIFEDYRTRIAGLYARLYQGRCLQKLASTRKRSRFSTSCWLKPTRPMNSASSSSARWPWPSNRGSRNNYILK